MDRDGEGSTDISIDSSEVRFKINVLSIKHMQNPILKFMECTLWD